MPGHTLTLRCGSNPDSRDQAISGILPARPSSNSAAMTEWIAECRTRLEEAVRMRLMSDVPLGMFLSGGVDSSAIAAHYQAHDRGPVKTFAVGYGEADFSELTYARQVAERIGTDHHEVVISMDDFFNALPQLVWHEDEPISWPSSVSLYFRVQVWPPSR